MYASGDDILIQDPVEWGHPLNQGLVSWWMSLPALPRGLRWHDLTRRNHGTLTNGPTWQGARGRPGGWGALSFDGSDDYVDSAYQPTLTACTLSVYWMYTGNPASYPNIFGWPVGSSGPTYGLSLMQAGPSGNYFYGELKTSSIGVSVNVGAITGWTLLTLTWDGSTLAIYANGRLVESAAAANGAFTPTRPLYSAVRVDGGTVNFGPGLADDYRAYLRALSATDVAALYAESRAGYPGCLRRVRRAAWSVPAAPGGGVPLGTLALLGCGR